MKYAVILGGGLMGSSAAWQLVHKGWKVHLIEQQSSIYEHGSSFGNARIARSLGPKNDLWAFLHNKTVEEIQTLIEFLQQYDSEDHCIDDVYTTSPVNYIFFEEAIQLGGFEGVLENPVDFCQYAFDNKQAKELFDIQLPQNARAFVRENKKYSGTLNPQQLICKLHRAILLKGGKISYNCTVSAVNLVTQKYHLKVQEKHKKQYTITTDYLLCAAGPYCLGLLDSIFPQISLLIKPQRVFVAYFSFDKKVYNQWSKAQKDRLFAMYPAIYFNKELSFSMVEEVDFDGIPIIKIGGHFCRSNYTDIDAVWKQKLSDAEIEWAKEATIKHLVCSNLPTTCLYYKKGYSCVYSLTEDEIPIVSKIPAVKEDFLKGFVFMGGMSGVGAKGCLAYGKIAANILSNEQEGLSKNYQKALKKLSLKDAK